MGKAFLAVDWGTTNRRVYRIEGGQVTATERDKRGVRAIRREEYPSDIAALRARLGDLPVLIAGMAGSNIGWRTVPYVSTPAGLDALVGGLALIDERTAIVPGIAQAAPADVMRGEEVQLLGAVAGKMVPDRALLCQPGTHCKWADIHDGRIVRFATAMTGEMYGLFRDHSILAVHLTGDVAADEEFREGVLRGAGCALQTELFGIRARAILHGAENAASFVSGLLIGADVHSRLDGRPVHVLADDHLGHLYHTAIDTLGGNALLIDSHDAFVAGIVDIGEQWL